MKIAALLALVLCATSSLAGPPQGAARVKAAPPAQAAAKATSLRRARVIKFVHTQMTTEVPGARNVPAAGRMSRKAFGDLVRDGVSKASPAALGLLERIVESGTMVIGGTPHRLRIFSHGVRDGVTLENRDTGVEAQIERVW